MPFQQLLLASVSLAIAASLSVSLHGTSVGHRFDGHGALSAGASSRLLIDYPKPQRDEILDLLFKPLYGMSLQVLKVEIGGDTQSTDGTEPSHARSREEMKDCNVERGYETWLLQEAKKRNPDIVVIGLSWGVPGWINSGDFAHPTYFTRDNIDYQVSWVRCVKEKFGIMTDFLGIWNERPWGNTDYITELRSALDDAGFDKATTGLVMMDGGSGYDSFKEHLLTNSTFANAVDAVGIHYPCNFPDADIVNVAKKKYWSSEDFSTPADWSGAGCWGRMLNSNYVRMNMTSTISWALLWSVYPNLDCFGNGLMYAFEPWSGHYEINPTVWTTAHTTQFSQPGWYYLRVGPDGGSGILPGGGGTYVTLREASESRSVFQWTLVVETLAGRCMYHDGCFSTGTWDSTRHVSFKLVDFASGAQTSSRLSLWVTNATHQFLQLPDIAVSEDMFSIDIAPDSILTVSTMKGQSKAGAPSPIAPPASRAFPIPYADNFNAYPDGSLPRYWSDQAGVFEVGQRGVDSNPLRALGSEKVLKQVINRCPIQWVGNADPFTLIGGVNWTNYRISVDAAFHGTPSTTVPASGCGGAHGSNSTYVGLCGRVSSWAGFAGSPISGYCMRVSADGSWSLSAELPTILASGKTSLRDRWNTLSLEFSDSLVHAWINDDLVVEISSTAFGLGLVALSSGWHGASFDNFEVVAVQPKPQVPDKLVVGMQKLSFDYNQRTCNPHPQATATSRNNFQGRVGLAFAVTREVMVNTLLRYKIDGNVGQHVLELLEVQGSTLHSIVSTSVNMSSRSPLDALGFASASLKQPVQLTVGHTYLLVSGESAGGDAWLDQLPIQANSDFTFSVLGSVYIPAGSEEVSFGKKGQFSYGPVSLYFSAETLVI